MPLGRAELRQYRSRVYCGLGGGVRLLLLHRAHLTVLASGPLRQPFLPVMEPAIGAVTLVGTAEHVPAVAVVPCTHPSESPQSDGMLAEQLSMWAQCETFTSTPLRG